MSKSIEWQAVPDDWEELRQVRSSERFIIPLFLLLDFFDRERGPWRVRTYPELQGIYDEVCALRAMRPGIEERNFTADAGRLGEPPSGWYSTLEYAMNKYIFLTGHGQNGSGEKLIQKAVYGTQELYKSPHTYSTITYNSPTDVLEVALLLESISCVTLETYNRYDVKAEDVLKSHNWFHKYDDATRLASWSSQGVCEIYEGMRSVYLAAAEHDEGVLVLIW